MHESRLAELTHSGIDDREPGFTGFPGFEAAFGGRSGVGLDGVEVAVPVAPGTRRPVVQHIGVEIAECQLPQILLGSAVAQIQRGSHRPGMDGAELQVRRHPAGALEVRTVAVRAIAIKSVVGERFPMPQRRLLADIEAKRDTRVGDLARAHAQLRRIDPASGIGGRAGRLSPALFAPGAENGVKTR
jgi:hypothetical protein